MSGLFLLSNSRFSSMKMGIMLWTKLFLTACVIALPLAAGEDAPLSPSSSMSPESDEDPRLVGSRISLQTRIWKAS